MTETELHWVQWKEERCYLFEKKGSQTIKGKLQRRREEKLMDKEAKRMGKYINLTP